jgi:dCMP deaminase
MNKWQQAYMDTAERFGALSTAKRLQVGAIVVKDNRIISIGYNGMPSGWDNECEDENFKTKPEVLHAEENAIAKLASSHESGKGAEIYITHSPCMNCAKLIYASGIAKVYYKHKYRSEDGIHFLEKCGLEVKRL